MARQISLSLLLQKWHLKHMKERRLIANGIHSVHVGPIGIHVLWQGDFIITQTAPSTILDIYD